MLKKYLLSFTLVIYLIGLFYGVINAKINLYLLFENFNIEKGLFLLYNIYIILSLIILSFKNLKNKFNIYKFSIYSLIGYISFHLMYFIWKTYEILMLYNLKTDATGLIANSLINPTGLLPNITILLILLQVTINLHSEKS